MNLGLKAITKCLEDLGNPQDSFPVIYITGTNGKGSLCMLLSKFFRQYNIKRPETMSAARACPTKTPRLCWGVFTSPPLLGPWDTIQIDGRAISRWDYEKRRRMLENTVDSFPPLTGFEKSVVVGMTLFKDHGIQVGIIEAGIGHMLDATNVFSEESVIASVLTAISVDHSEILGDTVESIAAHKIRLGRKGRPMFVGPQSSGGLTEMIAAKFQDSGIGPIYCVERICKVFSDGNQFRCEIQGLGGEKAYQIKIEHFPLLGDHQRKVNLPTAICIFLYTISDRFKESDQDQAIRSIADGWSGVRLPGRLERLDDVCDIYKGIEKRTPLPDGWEGNVSIILDGAHNVGGMHELTGFVKKMENPGIKMCWIIGITDEKDVHGILSQIKGCWSGGETVGERWFYFVEFKGPVSMEWVKCVPPSKLRKIFSELSHERADEQSDETHSRMTKEGASIVEDMSLEEALVDCIKEKGKKTTIIITGSLYLVSDFYRLREKVKDLSRCY